MIERELLEDMGFRQTDGWGCEVWFGGYDGGPCDFWVHYAHADDSERPNHINGLTATRKEFFAKLYAALVEWHRVIEYPEPY